MDRRIVWLFVAVGSTVGGFLPEVWGASVFGLGSLAFTTLGGIAGVWAALRLTG